MHGKWSLGSAHFSELSLRYAFYALLRIDRSKMRLLPEAVFSEIECYIGNPWCTYFTYEIPNKIL
jgi:hypothetical protein